MAGISSRGNVPASKCSPIIGKHLIGDELLDGIAHQTLVFTEQPVDVIEIGGGRQRGRAVF